MTLNPDIRDLNPLMGQNHLPSLHTSMLLENWYGTQERVIERDEAKLKELVLQSV